MIIRVFRAVVHDGKQDDFRSFFLGTALPLIRSQDGIVSASVGLPHQSSPNEFCMVMVWRDIEAIKGFAGESWDQAVVHPDEAHLLRETSVSHYVAESDADI